MGELMQLPRRGDLPAASGYAALPPKEVWQYDLDNMHLEMPVDERGLVDTQELVDTVASVVDSDYVWPNRLSVHHLYWHEQWYRSSFAGPYARSFRELPINKILVPRQFENVLHKVMEPPAVPQIDVMRQQMDSWVVARNLFASVRSVVRLEKSEERYLRMINEGTLPEGYETEDEIGRAVLRRLITRNSKGIVMHMRSLTEVSPEFRLVEPEDEVVEPTSETMQQRQAFASRLGALVVPEAVPVVRQLKVA